VGTRFSRGISSSTWHTCFRVRADDRGKNASGYRKVLRAHVLSRCALTRVGDGRYSAATEMKSPAYARDANDFFVTVILLYDRPFFLCAHRIRTSVFNPSGKKTYRSKEETTRDGELSTAPGVDGIFYNPRVRVRLKILPFLIRKVRR